MAEHYLIEGDEEGDEGRDEVGEAQIIPSLRLLRWNNLVSLFHN